MRILGGLLPALEAWHRRCADELASGLDRPASCRHAHAAEGRELDCRICGKPVFIRGDYAVPGGAMEALGLILLGLVLLASPYWLAATWLAAGLAVVGSLVVATGAAMLGSFFLGMLAGGVLGVVVGAGVAGAAGWALVALQAVIALFGLLARLSVLSRARLDRGCRSTMRWIERVMALIRRESVDGGR